MMDRSSDADVRYARGEITRDEWTRLRQSGTAAPGISPTRAPPGRRNRTLSVAAVIVVVLVVVGALAIHLVSSSGMSPIYGAPRQLTSSDLGVLNTSAALGTAYPSNNTLWFRSGPVALVVYASPPEHDLTFVIQGLVNPTIHVAPRARVTITVVNMDSDMYHDWVLSSRGPPYSSMPMMGSGMMVSTTMLRPATGGGYWSQEIAFTTSGGSYWFLCEYPDHADEGMYGQFAVG